MSQDFLNQYWWIILLGAVWELVWKGWSLWVAARKNSKAWFIVLLLVNTFGILPIAYIFIFSKEEDSRT
jgi:hypothetical protein